MDLSRFGDLGVFPEPIFLYILEHLPPESLVSFCFTCKDASLLFNNVDLWAVLAERDDCVSEKRFKNELKTTHQLWNDLQSLKNPFETFLKEIDKKVQRIRVTKCTFLEDVKDDVNIFHQGVISLQNAIKVEKSKATAYDYYRHLCFINKTWICKWKSPAGIYDPSFKFPCGNLIKDRQKFCSECLGKTYEPSNESGMVLDAEELSNGFYRCQIYPWVISMNSEGVATLIGVNVISDGKITAEIRPASEKEQKDAMKYNIQTLNPM